ncbi:MAG TPA: hypothetical protein VFP37_15475 [Steroidobacteraceae bacterium]|nr:hypothetical protein [Steroidobacteraceae bacterium]
MTSHSLRLLGGGCAIGALAAIAMAQTGGGAASISVASGPHKGEYAFSPTQPCIIASLGQKPPGISLVLQATDSSLSIEMPNLDEKHANEIQIVLVIADKQRAVGKGASSVTYEIDTRPDAALAPFQRAERANKGMSGKATTTLMEKGDTALLSFSGETVSGVKLEGSVTCKKV